MSDKVVRGYIDCPSCGTPGGMRITSDKNGDPFGFCTATCRQQLRVGPDPERVALFEANHAKRLATAAPAPAPAAPVAAPAPVAEPPPPPAAPKRTGLADALHFMAGGAR
ncbi:hypothetical protein [Hydrogenophaga intermedia]|uniref:Uncharacterized protein n=1 Tax=Hydrogenophaga intermedia TaxID=65786 RepID=A0A1L1PKN4_HYDIT|nr:hypothetical protein [Hydrogenophaga intermedia]TMU72428.1 hypothetical protein FGJ01_18815 [Hydrogenophaga intermedia]CDN87497.1 hypothetical protein BN948_01919 [Hydrogenophaga intermedia]